MVLYACEKCNKEFNRKSSYNNHLNKKNPCDKKVNDVTNKLNIIQNNPKKSKLIQNDINNDNIKTKCPQCSKIFSTVPNLNKHLKNSCKIKKQNEIEKEQIFKKLLEQDNTINEQKKLINSILQQNKNILMQHENTMKENKRLAAKISKLEKSTKTQNNVINSNNTTNNNTTNIINLVDFGKENLTIVDKAEFIKVLNNRAISGVTITDELVKAIHFNNKYPQLNNVYISDINRNKFMIVQDNKWTLTHVDQIPRVIENAVKYSYNKNEELSEKYKNNKFISDRLKIVDKYTKLSDENHLNALVEDDANPKDIQRCKDFQSQLYGTIKDTLYNNKKAVKVKN